MTVGDYLKLKRKESKISLRQLAYKINMSHTNIADVEKGKIKRLITLNKIMDGLKLNLEEREKALELLDLELDSSGLGTKYLLLKDECEILKKRLQECEKNLVIAHNNSGHIVVGDNNVTGKINSTGARLQDEFEDLTERQKEKVIKFINDFIK